ncbi:Tim44/TimA family putative adaptor protein [Asticcacaulis sp. BYS171W]|uniref:Tim44/TimA family putative adaptor protein n=1 Tax=Asticcacaulis aquaticus TaxID=2984212 RepID=A0ABT5HSY4_9CAUL|nr:Tim44/TimA family putative adaptor protein [Asticcacaulis aquaticus]MDC7683063.1 Tim44/TimA family putative adaptor protein [Asticcacaulis aquaticus]
MSWELLILALVAVVVLFQLYNVLGRRVGFKAEDKPGAPRIEDTEGPIGRPAQDKPSDRLRLPNLDALKAKDSNFNEANFVEKSREAYEQIVLAFNRGEIDGLKERLSEDVFAVFGKAIAARGEAKAIAVAFVDSPKADMDLIDLKDDRAQVRMRFLSELVYETRTPPAEVGQPDQVHKQHRRTAEYWTFQKNLKSAANPWILVRVEAAKA